MSSEAGLGRHVRQRTRELEASIAAVRHGEQRLERELQAAERLQQIATQLITARGTQALFEQILNNAVAILHSDFASIQILYPERGELRLVGHRGFSPQAAKRWEWVGPSGRSICSEAFRTGRRVVVPDVRKCDFMAGSEDLGEYLDGGISASQSTPLIALSGELLGMVSTHWRQPHDLSSIDLRFLDILARLAADVIERMRAVDELQKALEKLQFVTENMTCGVTRCSHDLRYLWVNGSYAAWLGRPPDEIIGHPILDILGPTAYERIRPHVEKVLSGRRTEYEMQVDFRGIGPRWIHAVYMPTRSLEDNVDGWVAVVTDITNARRLQEESASRQKLESVGTLASGIAHDFNNILGGVLAQAELALGQLAAGLRPEEQLKAIRDVAIRGAEIVRELMIYAGRGRENREVVNLSQLVREMLQLLKVSVCKNAVFETDFGEDLPAVWTNAAQLRQIVMNLVTNASEALEERDGVIRVATRCVKVDRDSSAQTSDRLADGDYVLLEVSDTGSGMSPETQAQVFDPFFTTKAAGHGLGLAVVSGIVRGLGGAIDLSSELGRGTTFRILLPSAETAGHATSYAPPPSEDSASCEGTAVLVVEDEDPLRGAVVQMLRNQGCEVIEATNGSSAIDLLRTRNGKIDAILLDVTIPGASSQEVAAEAAKAQPDSRVILTSAYSPEIITRAVEAPTVVSFIRKPYKIADLLQTLRRVLSS